MSETVKSWGVGTYVFTQLVNHLNQVSSFIFIGKQKCRFLIITWFKGKSYTFGKARTL